MSWSTAAILALILATVIAVVFGVLFERERRKSRPTEQKPPKGQPVDLVKPWRRIRADLRPEERFGPAVVALGDDGWKSSRVLEQLSGGSPAVPSASGAGMRCYRGNQAVVVELSDEVIQSEADVVDKALSRLFQELCDGVVFVAFSCDYRSLEPSRAAELARWAEVLQRRLPELRRSGRSVGFRIVVTGLDAEDGYSTFRDLWLSGRADPIAFRELEESGALQGAFAHVENGLSAVLCARPEGLESAVRVVQALPHKLRVLRALTVPLTDTLERATDPSLGGVFLTDTEGSSMPRAPFAFRPADASRAGAAQRKASMRRHLVAVAAAALATLLLFLVHGQWLGWIQRQNHPYTSVLEPGRRVLAARSAEEVVPPDQNPTWLSEAEAPNGAAGARLTTNEQALRAGTALRTLRYWALPFAYVPQRRELSTGFLEATRRHYVLPSLAPSRSLMRRVLSAVLDRATSDNDSGRLVLENRDVWARKLEMPRETVSEFVRSRSDLPTSGVLGQLDGPANALEDWRARLSSLARAVDAGVFQASELRQIREEPFLGGLPDNADELRILQLAVGLLDADYGLSREDADAAGRIQAELDFLSQNFEALSRLRRWLAESPPLAEVPPPTTLAQLMERVRPPEEPENKASKEKPALSEGSVTITFERPVTIAREDFELAARRTQARSALVSFMSSRRALPSSPPYDSACPRPMDLGVGGGFFPLRPGTSQGAASLDSLDSFRVQGPTSRGYGPTASLPGWFTREAFTRYVQPVTAALSKRPVSTNLSPDDQAELEYYVQGQLNEYAATYGAELFCYYESFRFNPSSLALAESAITELAADGSWFFRFVQEAARQADLPSDEDGFGSMRQQLAGFEPLVATAKGKALSDYGAILLSGLPKAAGPPPEKGPEMDVAPINPRLAKALAVLGATDRVAPVAGDLEGWLAQQSITGGYGRPFRLPWASLRQAALRDIDQGWRSDLVGPSRVLLRKYPFAATGIASGKPVSVEELEAEFGPRGRIWTKVNDALAPLVVSYVEQGRRSWAMRGDLPSLDHLLDFLNSAQRLTDALWKTDGTRHKLSIGVTPHDLPESHPGEVLIALAHLSLPGDAVQSFNQALEKRSLQVNWWSPGTSKLTVEVLDEYASEVVSFHTLARRQGLWSFLQLFDGAQGADHVLTFQAPQRTGVPGAVRFGLDRDLGLLFRDVARAAGEARGQGS